MAGIKTSGPGCLSRLYDELCCISDIQHQNITARMKRIASNIGHLSNHPNNLHDRTIRHDRPALENRIHDQHNDH
jgi:hypothetical protein